MRPERIDLVTAKLRYWGTNDDVLPGDRVEYSSLIFRRKKRGTVVCIPSKTALELDAERKAPEDWLIKFDDGTYTGWMYHPEELQPNKRLRLISRHSEYEPITNSELERQDAKTANESGWKHDLAGCGILIVVGLVAIAVVAVALLGTPW